MESYSNLVSNYGFSAIGIDDLGATEYTLVTIACDTSQSVQGDKVQMEACLKEIVQACRTSPRKDHLMLRLLTFDDTVHEIHGFKPLQDCKVNNYVDCLNIGCYTALNDAVVNSLESLKKYGQELVDNDFGTNGILVVITDGFNNLSSASIADAKQILDDINKEESLESLVTILVGIKSSSELNVYLTGFKNDIGFDQYVDLADASAATLSKLAKFVSKSISSQSQALGTGQAPARRMIF